MFSENPAILLCLTSKSLRMISPDQEIDKTFDFPEGLIKNGEIANKEKFKEALGKFFQDNPAKGDAILLPSETLIFKEKLKEQNKKEIEKFLEYVPLKPDSVQQLIVKKDSSEELFVTNKIFCNLVKEIAKANNIEILYITPISAFEETYLPEKLSVADAEDILKNTEVLETYNFLSDNSPINSEEKMTDDKNSLVHIIVATVSLVAFFISLFFILLGFDIIPNPFKNFTKNKTIQPVAIPSISPSPTPLPIDKSTIKIQILNGSGISGQARVTSNALTPLGYSDITTGNADESTASATIIIYKKTVPKTIVDEISDALKKIFSTVNTEETIQSDFDISIITGQ